MRRSIPGFRSDGERDRRQAARQETIENLEDAGIPTGGFEGGSSVRSQMSPQLLRRLAESEAEEAYQASKLERQRAIRAEQWQQRSEESARQIAIVEALEAGEDASPRALRGERLGHTVGEFVALMSARQDHEDMVLEAEKARARRRWEAQYDAGNSGDTSAPSQRQIEAEQLMQERVKRFRHEEYGRRLAVREARRLAAQDAARGDREVLGRVAHAASTALRGEAGAQFEYRTEYRA